MMKSLYDMEMVHSSGILGNLTVLIMKENLKKHLIPIFDPSSYKIIELWINEKNIILIFEIGIEMFSTFPTI